MTENHDLAPAPDVDEQRRPVVEDVEGGEISVSMDADPADAADQAEPVEFDDEDR